MLFVEWKSGCHVLQTRGSLVTKREFGLVVKLNNAIAKLVYFESPFSALCKRSGAGFSDVLLEMVDIYPARIDLDSYFTFQKYFMTDKFVFWYQSMMAQAF